jgi:hypothetical protein
MSSAVCRATQVFNGVTIAASSTATSNPVNMAPAQALALHLTAISGTSPSVTFTYSLGISEEGPYTIPQSPATIGATKSAVDVMDFAPEAASYIKIVATNNNGTNAATITGYLVVQETT